MKRFLLLLLVLGAANQAFAADYSPIVDEGKTYWYYQPDLHVSYTAPNGMGGYEYGFRISGRTTDDQGEEWNEIRLVKRATNFGGKITECAECDEFVQLIRENDHKVVTREHANPSLCFASHLSLYEIFLLYADLETYDYTIYDFSYDSENLMFGNESSHYVLEFIEEAELIENERTHRVKYYKVKDTVGNEYLPINSCGKADRVTYIEGVGFKADAEDGTEGLSELFFAPMGIDPYAHTPICRPFMLRYVTDEDDNILYEGAGGLKLWEVEPMGISDAVIDSGAQEEWFNLAGMKVNQPSEPGIYIRKVGCRHFKVRF